MIKIYKDDTTFESFQLKEAESVLSYIQKLARNIGNDIVKYGYR